MSVTLKETHVGTKLSEKVESTKYFWISTRRSDFEKITEVVPSFRSCHINNKSSQKPLEIIHNINDGHVIYPHIYGWVKINPKWLTVLKNDDGKIETNDIKQSRHRKIKTIKRFTDFYEPLYRKKKVSLLIFTFTRVNYARLDIPILVEVLKKRLRALKWPLRGYLWVLEVKESDNIDGGYNIHYHLIIATDRVRTKSIPAALKLENLWGQRTGVEFVKYSIRRYLSKYLTKENKSMLRMRSYGISCVLK